MPPPFPLSVVSVFPANAMAHPHTPPKCPLRFGPGAPKRCDRPGDDDRFRGVRSVPITNPNEAAWASLFWEGALSSTVDFCHALSWRLPEP